MDKKIKRKNSKINKKKKNIINAVILLVIIFIITILCATMSPKNKAKSRLKKINDPIELPENIKVIEYLNRINAIYEGEVTSPVLIKTYYNFAQNIIPTYYKKCKDMDLREIEKYFKKNKDLILIELGYTKFEDFNNFVNSIKTLKDQEFELEEYRILRTCVQKKGENVYAYISIKYKNNKELIFNTKIINKVQKEKTAVEYYCDIDSEKVEKDNEEEKKFKLDLETQENTVIRGYPIE